jgi:hypothetical protein
MYSSTLSLTSVLDRGGWSTARTDRFTSEKAPVPIVQEAGWTSGPVWTENTAPTGIRFPNRPACSKSLYRLIYPRTLATTGTTSKSFGSPSFSLMRTDCKPFFKKKKNFLQGSEAVYSGSYSLPLQRNWLPSSPGCSRFFRKVSTLLLHHTSPYPRGQQYSQSPSW